MKYGLLRCLAVLLCFWASPGLAQNGRAEIVAAGELPGVGYVTVQRTAEDIIDAQIGRWDTPYPYPDTGQRAPGLQPTGLSIFYIDVDVNDGGTAAFSYLLQTYDAGVWDWYDILIQTPTGEVRLADRLGKPGRQYGTLWSSPRVALSYPLDQWANQRIRFIFRVQQDGWGDQTQGQVIRFALTDCPVPSLTPLTDPDAISFEQGNRIITNRLTQATQTGLACMQQRVADLRGTFDLSSAYRPVAYQAHLREVWDRWQLLRNNRNPQCATLKEQVRNEFAVNHVLVPTIRPAAGNPNAPHSRGIAFDATIIGLTQGETVDTVANGCGMRRPYANDPPHYQPQ